MLQVIWKKKFKRMIRQMERQKREENIKKIQNTPTVDEIGYLSGIDDGYYMACEDILKWIEGKKDKKN